MKNKIDFKFLFEIYITFLKLGSVSFGGGYAIISLMENEIVERKKWIEKDKIIDVFSVAQSLPGAIALNASAFVGYSIAGIPGAIAALLGNLTPSVVIMATLSIVFTRFSENKYVKSAFSGIRPVIVGLITYAAYKIGKTAIKDIYCVFIALLAFILAIVFHISVIGIIIGGVVVGLILYLIKWKLNIGKVEKVIKVDKLNIETTVEKEGER